MAKFSVSTKSKILRSLGNLRQLKNGSLIKLKYSIARHQHTDVEKPEHPIIERLSFQIYCRTSGDKPLKLYDTGPSNLTLKGKYFRGYTPTNRQGRPIPSTPHKFIFDLVARLYHLLSSTLPAYDHPHFDGTTYQ